MWKNLEGKEYNSVEDFGENVYGFVYKIINKETNKLYIGKKVLSFDRKKKLGKKELKLIPVKQGRRPTSKRVITESDWKTYYGSSDELINDVKTLGEDKFDRIVIQLAYNSKQLSYFEVLYQMSENVLQIDSYNKNILGKFYKKDFDN